MGKEIALINFHIVSLYLRHRSSVEDRTTKNNQDDCCAGRDKNTEPPKCRYNGCPLAYSIVFNLIYLRDFVTVGALTVNCYAVFNTGTTSLLFRFVIN